MKAFNDHTDNFPTRRVGSVALCLFSVIFTATTFAQDLIPAPDSSSSLGQKWTWGSALALDSSENSAWVVYQFNAELDEKISIAISSHENDYYQWNNRRGGSSANNWYYRDSNNWNHGLSIQSILAGNETSQQDFPVSKDLLFLANYSYGELREIRVVEASSVVSWRQSPVYWLGRVSEEESFRFLVGLLDSSDSRGISSALVRAIGLHSAPDRNAFLDRALNDEGYSEIRAAIIESLALQESSDVQSLLMNAASDENEAALVRRIAISALSRYDSAEAESLLINLSSSLNPQVVRKEALESLGAFSSNEVMRTLNAVVLTESNSEVVEEALRSLSLHPDQFEVISTVAQNHNDSEIREEAISVLGSMDIIRAFDILKSIAEADESYDVREEAIEEIEDAPQELAALYLVAFAEAEDQHPLDVRKKAVESLSSFDAALVLTPLNHLAWSDSSEDIREEAVDSLADLENVQANTLLLDIAKNHPSSHTRNEALDKLQDNLL